MANCVPLGVAVHGDTMPARSADPSERAKGLGVEAAVDAAAALDIVVLDLDGAGSVVLVVVVAVVAACDRAGRRDSLAVVAFVDSAVRPNDSLPNCYQARVAVVQGPVAGSVHVHPIVDQAERLVRLVVDRLADVHPAAEAHLGLVNLWSAGPSTMLGAL